jgi:hypothetical protein
MGSRRARRIAKKLVGRTALESIGIKLEHAPIGEMFCPTSGQGLAFPDEEHELPSVDKELFCGR